MYGPIRFKPKPTNTEEYIPYTEAEVVLDPESIPLVGFSDSSITVGRNYYLSPYNFNIDKIEFIVSTPKGKWGKTFDNKEDALFYARLVHVKHNVRVQVSKKVTIKPYSEFVDQLW